MERLVKEYMNLLDGEEMLQISSGNWKNDKKHLGVRLELIKGTMIFSMF